MFFLIILECGGGTILHGVGVLVRHLPAAVNADDEQESSQGVGAVHRWSFCWEGRKHFICNMSTQHEGERGDRKEREEALTCGASGAGTLKCAEWLSARRAVSQLPLDESRLI